MNLTIAGWYFRPVARTPSAVMAVVIVLFGIAAESACSDHSAVSTAAGNRSQTTTSASPSASAPGSQPSVPPAVTSASASASSSPTPTPSAKSSSASKPAPKTSASSAPSPLSKAPTGPWPNAGNTGVKPGTQLVPKKGEINVNQNGAVIENIDLVGDIRVEANNVTIRNVRITAPQGGDIDQWGILQWVGYSGLTVEDSEIIGNSGTELRQAVMNPGGMITVKRCNIHGMSKKGVYSSQGDIEDNYIHDPYWFAAADGEIDMIRVDGTPDNGLSLLVRHNSLVDTNTTNSAISLFEADGGQPTRVTVDGNYMATTGFSIYAGGASAGTSYIVVTNNVFAKKFGDGYSYVTEWNPHGTGNVWSGNRWEDGKPAPVIIGH